VDIAILLVGISTTIWFSVFTPRSMSMKLFLAFVAIVCLIYGISVIILSRIEVMKIPLWAIVFAGMIVGGIAAGLAWQHTSKHTSPAIIKDDPKPDIESENIKNFTETDKPKLDVPQEKHFPFIDIELEEVNEYSYDIFVHNKSNVALSQIVISRMVNPEKNKQKIAVRGDTPKLRSLQKTISVLASGEKKKIHREHIPSWEYAIFIVHYRDDTDKQYRCIFEGDKSGLRLTEKSLIPKQALK